MTALSARLLLIVVLACAALRPAWPQAGDATEAQLKAAYLYQFGGFVEWPPQAFTAADAPFTIGLVGADAIAQELEQIVATRTVHGRRVLVRRLQPEESLAGLQVLFVAEPHAAALPRMLAAGAGVALLVVTDASEGLPPGSAINFVAVDGRVRFDIAPGQAERSRIRISARLLAVARRIVRG
jgi:hypothetical protein